MGECAFSLIGFRCFECVDGMDVDSVSMMMAVHLHSASMTWFNVMQCVRMELFPMISVKISECVQEKLLMDSSFKMSDIGKEAVMDIIERLKAKRTMNNVEVTYLEGLFQRANQHKMAIGGLLLVTWHDILLTLKLSKLA